MLLRIWTPSETRSSSCTGWLQLACPLWPASQGLKPLGPSNAPPQDIPIRNVDKMWNAHNRHGGKHCTSIWLVWHNLKNIICVCTSLVFLLYIWRITHCSHITRSVWPWETCLSSAFLPSSAQPQSELEAELALFSLNPSYKWLLHHNKWLWRNYKWLLHPPVKVYLDAYIPSICCSR